MHTACGMCTPPTLRVHSSTLTHDSDAHRRFLRYAYTIFRLGVQAHHADQNTQFKLRLRLKIRYKYAGQVGQRLIIYLSYAGHRLIIKLLIGHV